MATGKHIDELLALIRDLPVPERLRLVERVVHEVAAAESGEMAEVQPASIIGLFADEPDLMQAVSESAMTARERDPLRRS